MARLACALVCLLLAGDLAAGPGDAELLVHLTTPSAGATATVRSRDTGWRASAAGRQDLRIAAVPPGAYELRVEAAGLEPVAAELSLAAGEVLRLEAHLVEAGAGASALVIAERARPRLGASFDEQALGDLPSSRTPWSILETAEATAILDRIEGPGLYAGEPGLLGIHGSSWTQTGYRLGGLDLTDPGQIGTPMVQPAFLGLTAIDVITGLAPVEIGPPGPMLVIAPRRPAATWRGSALAELAPAHGGAPATPPPIARADGVADGEARLEGPLVRDRLGLDLTASLARSRRFERDTVQPLEGRLASLLGQLVWSASPRDELDWTFTLQQARAPDVRRARLARPDLSTSQGAVSLQATWTRRAATLVAITGAFARASSDPGDPGSAAPAVVERLRYGPVERLFPGHATRMVGGLEAQATPPAFRFLGVLHLSRFGGTVARKSEDTRPIDGPGLTPETVNGVAARVWDYGWPGPEARWRDTEAAAWAADRVRLARLTVEAGFRLDRVHASRGSDAATIDWTTFSPRITARLGLLGRDRLAAIGGWGRYAHRLPLDLLAFGDVAAPQGAAYRWDDANGDARLQPGEVGPLVARVGPGSAVAALDPRLGPPRTDEAVAGFEAHVAGDWRGRLVALRRRERRLVAAVNVGIGPGDHDVISVLDPGGDLLGPADDQLLPIFDRRPESFGRDRYLLTNPAGENSLHEGVELELLGALGRRGWLRVGAAASRTTGPAANRGFRVVENDQDLVGERLESPNAQTNARGRLFFDRAYTLKIAGGWRAPGDVRLGAVARYQDGQPFARVVVAPALRQGADFVQAIPNGRSRFSFTATVDVRLEKGFALGRRRLAGSVAVFNIADSAREVEEDVTTGASFRAVTAVQPPRAVRLGLRLDF